MGQKLGDFLKNRELATNMYIFFMLHQYIDAPKDLARFGDTARTPTKNQRNINFELYTHQIQSLLPDDAEGILSINILT
jgi:hypothetical protein